MIGPMGEDRTITSVVGRPQLLDYLSHLLGINHRYRGPGEDVSLWVRHQIGLGSFHTHLSMERLPEMTSTSPIVAFGESALDKDGLLRSQSTGNALTGSGNELGQTET